MADALTSLPFLGGAQGYTRLADGSYAMNLAGLFGIRSTLFPTGTEAGLWYDPPTTTSGYQESTGQTLLYEPGAGSIDPPVGLRLDKHAGSAYSTAELISNPGGPFTSTTGYAPINGALLSVVSGTLRVQNDATGTAFSYASISFPTVVGKNYRVLTTSTPGAGAGRSVHAGTTQGSTTYAANNQSGVFWFKAVGTTCFVSLNTGTNTASVFVDYSNLNVTEWFPGSHVSQATAAARPTLSSRVNLLTKTPLLTDAAWVKTVSVTGGVSDPDGGLTAFTLTATGAGQYLEQAVGTISAGATPSIYIRRRTGTGAVSMYADNAYTALALTSSWQRLALAQTISALGYMSLRFATSGDQVDVWRPQVEVGGAGTPTSYQSVTDASTYDTAGFPQFDKFDGVDDLYGMTFAAATMSNNMDFFLVLKRDTAGNFISAFMDATHYFGMAESGSGSAATLAAGTPTYRVNNVAVPGGTATTRAQLYTALSAPGTWMVLSVHNLDLSAWTAWYEGFLASYPYANSDEQVILCPAQTDPIRAQVITRLGAPVGLVI